MSPARKKKEDTEQEEKTQEEETQAQEVPEVAVDQRVPSDPEHYRPADVPPAPLTRIRSSSNAD
jgi:hypothetical protein